MSYLVDRMAIYSGRVIGLIPKPLLKYYTLTGADHSATNKEDLILLRK